MASSVSPLTKRQKTVHVTPKKNGELHETKTEEKEFKFSDSPSLDQL